MTHHRKPRGWAAVPGPAKAPVFGIVVLVVLYTAVLVAGVSALCGLIGMLFS